MSFKMDCTWSNRGSCDKFSKIKKKNNFQKRTFSVHNVTWNAFIKCY